MAAVIVGVVVGFGGPTPAWSAVGFGLFGAGSLGLAAVAVRSGAILRRNRLQSDIYRATEPFGFWFIVAWYVVGGAIGFSVAWHALHAP